jgi:DNA polymerase-3 subunit epsilon
VVTARQVIVVDVETSGLDVDRHSTVEVAWWHLGTGQRGCFIPPHNVSKVLYEADIEALQINRYIDRIAAAPQDMTGEAGCELSELLHDNTLAATNPTFDDGFLTKMFRDYDNREFCGMPRWHHRRLDLSAYAAGVLGIPPTELPGLSDVCALLGVTNPAPHTAEGDVTATGNCFLRLFDRAANRRAALPPAARAHRAGRTPTAHHTGRTGHLERPRPLPLRTGTPGNRRVHRRSRHRGAQPRGRPGARDARAHGSHGALTAALALRAA